MAFININITHDNLLLDFLSPVVGVIVSAMIAWIVYRKQLIEKQIKDNISMFFYLYSIITKNYNQILATKYQISEPALKELDNTLSVLCEIEELLDWKYGKGKPPLELCIPEEYMDSYINQKLNTYSNSMVLSISTKLNFLFIDKKSFEKEANLLTYFGDTNFSVICNMLHSFYNIIDEIRSVIHLYNEENIEKPRSNYKEIVIENKPYKYKKQICRYKNQLLYRQTIFKVYDETLDRAILYSYNALNHLEVFFNKYQNKYKYAFKAIGISYKELSIEHEKLISNDDFWRLFSSLLEYEYSLFSVPIYSNLNRSIMDKLLDGIFYFGFHWDNKIVFCQNS